MTTEQMQCRWLPRPRVAHLLPVIERIVSADENTARVLIDGQIKIRPIQAVEAYYQPEHEA